VINDELPTENGEMPLPDWSLFEEEDLIDLDDELRVKFRERAIPSPAHVAIDPQQLVDERRYDVPITVISCEFPSSEIRKLIEQDDAYVRELAKVRDVDYLDLPTGHWPQFTRPEELGRAILTSLGA
jgi:pimeloyl-ACP methyl ester carboxylesterase